MFDPKAMLDALIGAMSRPASNQGNPTNQPTKTAQSGSGLDQALGQLTGQSSGQLLEKARDVISQNPKLAQAAFLGLTGLIFSKRKSGGVSSGLAKLGGLAVIGGLAYKAFQSRNQTTATPGTGPTTQNVSTTLADLGMPESSGFHPVSQTEDDAMLYLRAMVAAAAADGQVDAAERARIVKGMGEAGIDAEATQWLEQELSSPADVEELAATVNTPEKAAQVYVAARITIDPDTMQEREFLRQLAESLDLDPAVRSNIEDTVASLK